MSFAPSTLALATTRLAASGPHLLLPILRRPQPAAVSSLSAVLLGAVSHQRATMATASKINSTEKKSMLAPLDLKDSESVQRFQNANKNKAAYGARVRSLPPLFDGLPPWEVRDSKPGWLRPLKVKVSVGVMKLTYFFQKLNLRSKVDINHDEYLAIAENLHVKLFSTFAKGNKNELFRVTAHDIYEKMMEEIDRRKDMYSFKWERRKILEPTKFIHSATKDLGNGDILYQAMVKITSQQDLYVIPKGGNKHVDYWGVKNFDGSDASSPEGKPAKTLNLIEYVVVERIYNTETRRAISSPRLIGIMQTKEFDPSNVERTWKHYLWPFGRKKMNQTEKAEQQEQKQPQVS